MRGEFTLEFTLFWSDCSVSFTKRKQKRSARVGIRTRVGASTGLHDRPLHYPGMHKRSNRLTQHSLLRRGWIIKVSANFPGVLLLLMVPLNLAHMSKEHPVKYVLHLHIVLKQNVDVLKHSHLLAWFDR